MPSAKGQSAGVLPSALTHPSNDLSPSRTTAPGGGFAPRVASFGFAGSSAGRASAERPGRTAKRWTGPFGASMITPQGRDVRQSVWSLGVLSLARSQVCQFTLTPSEHKKRDSGRGQTCGSESDERNRR